MNASSRAVRRRNKATQRKAIHDRYAAEIRRARDEDWPCEHCGESLRLGAVLPIGIDRAHEDRVAVYSHTRCARPTLADRR